jgi:hypothetical protein
VDHLSAPKQGVARLEKANAQITLSSFYPSTSIPTKLLIGSTIPLRSMFSRIICNLLAYDRYMFGAERCRPQHVGSYGVMYFCCDFVRSCERTIALKSYASNPSARIRPQKIRFWPEPSSISICYKPAFLSSRRRKRSDISTAVGRRDAATRHTALA